MEAGVGFIETWLNLVGRDDFLMRDGCHLTKKLQFLCVSLSMVIGTVNLKTQYK